jgi:parvulin-like peptidyl-prolyl isomerase
MLQKNAKIFVAAIIYIVASLSPQLLGGTAAAQSRTLEEIVAWVNNDIILKSEYEKRKTQMREELASPPPNGGGLQGAQLEQAFNTQSKYILQQLIDETLILQQAKDMGLTAENEIIKAMDRLRQQRKLDSLDALEKEIVGQGYSLDDFKQNIRLSSQILRFAHQRLRSSCRLRYSRNNCPHSEPRARTYRSAAEEG